MKLMHLLVLGLIILASCGNSDTDKNTVNPPVKNEENPAPVNNEQETVETPASNPEKVGIEEAGLFKAKYCNYKYGALSLMVKSKKDTVRILEQHTEKDESPSTKDELANTRVEIQSLEKETESLKTVCAKDGFGDQCAAFQKDIQGNIDQLNGELTDDQESLQKWEGKLTDAKGDNKITDMTIAKAKVEKLTPRVEAGKNHLEAFKSMAEDLKGYCS